jgi:hypothetical protein
MLTELAGAAGAELVWASYWRDLANTWIAPRIGLPSLRFVRIRARWRAVPDRRWESGRRVTWRPGSGRHRLYGSKTIRVFLATSRSSQAWGGTWWSPLIRRLV